ncbi:MAG: hypothetical protein IPP63_13895 [Chloracidobacterium sp.]|nr:hypothetical protein [Chloracidobacterium sp.]
MPRAFDLGFDVFQLEGEYGGMTASEIKRLRELEEENAKLKAMYAEMSLRTSVEGLIEKGW